MEKSIAKYIKNKSRPPSYRSQLKAADELPNLTYTYNSSTIEMKRVFASASVSANNPYIRINFISALVFASADAADSHPHFECYQ